MSNAEQVWEVQTV